MALLPVRGDEARPASAFPSMVPSACPDWPEPSPSVVIASSSSPSSVPSSSSPPLPAAEPPLSRAHHQSLG